MVIGLAMVDVGGVVVGDGHERGEDALKAEGRPGSCAT